MAYGSQTIVEQILGRSLTANESSLLATVLSVADTYINDYVDNVFDTNPSETTRYYDGGDKIIDIHAVRNVTAITLVDADEVVENTYDDSEYELRPRNETIKKWVERRNFCWPDGVANIGVTGKFTLCEGATVPADIQYLSSFLAAYMLKPQFKDGLKSESIEGYSRTFNKATIDQPIVMQTLQKYKSIQI